jgi:hypothetical protein
MQKFEDVLRRRERKELSSIEDWGEWGSTRDWRADDPEGAERQITMHRLGAQAT